MKKVKNPQDSVRESEREAFCRFCDSTINKGDTMLSFYSHRNRGQSIHLCKECVDSFKTVDFYKENT